MAVIISLVLRILKPVLQRIKMLAIEVRSNIMEGIDNTDLAFVDYQYIGQPKESIVF